MRIQTTDYHTAGEPFRIVTGGVAPLEGAKKLKKNSGALPPDRLNELGAEGWEAVGLSLKQGDLIETFDEQEVART